MHGENAQTLNEELLIDHIARPFLKWVGGKRQLLLELRSRAPKKFKSYYEPFLGGGALFFNLQPANAYLSDINHDLVNAYCVVQNQVEELIEDLKKHVYEKDYFYNLRNIDRSEQFSDWTNVQKASRLIYLNKTCFNGLYRVNSKGFFNTPFGKYSDPTIVDSDNLRACSRALQGAKIAERSFSQIEEQLDADDFVYFDPPYAPLNCTSYFTDYSKDGFGSEMQTNLRDFCCRLDKLGVRFMLSNSDTPFITELYKDFLIEKVWASRSVNSQADKRGKISELLIRNYQ